MKKNYFKIICAVVVLVATSFTSVSAQLTELYNNDFSGLTGEAGSNMLTDTQPAGTWVAVNQPNVFDSFFSKTVDGGLLCSGWRGANLIGAPIENWASGNKVQFVTKHKITGALGASGKKLFFGITKRIPNGGGNPDADASTYRGNTNDIGLQITNTAAGELTFKLYNSNEAVATTELSAGEVIQITYTATKSATPNEFDISVTITREGTNFSDGDLTLIGTVNQAVVYAAATDLCFGVFAENAMTAVWSYVALSMEESEIILPAANAGASEVVVGNSSVTLEGSSNYDSDGSVVYEWAAPAGISLSGSDTKTPSFMAPDVDRVAHYKFGFKIKVTIDGEEYESPLNEVIITVNPQDGLYAEGDGTELDPYIISEVNHLYNLSLTPSDWKNKYFELTNSLDLTGDDNFHPIGEGETFTGHFDGKFNLITGLTVDVASGFAGMFGEVVGGATISNLCLVEPSITSGSTASAGAIAAKFNDSGTQISHCCVIGGSVTSNGNAGGLVGEIMNWGTPVISVMNCFSGAYVDGVWGSGGIVGGWNTSSASQVGIEKSAFYGVSKAEAIMTNNAVMVAEKVSITDCYYLAGSGTANNIAISESIIEQVDLNKVGSYPNLNFTTAVGDDFNSKWVISTKFGCAVLQGFDLSAVSANFATDLENDIKEVSLNVYPNPVVDILNITDVADGSIITVYSATGSIVSVIKAAGGLTQVDLSSQPTGVYLVKVADKVTRVLKK